MRMNSTITSGERDILNYAAFASNAILLDSWRFNAGLRIDRQNFTQTTLSPRLSVVFTPATGHQLRAAFNIGSRTVNLDAVDRVVSVFPWAVGTVVAMALIGVVLARVGERVAPASS